MDVYPEVLNRGLMHVMVRRPSILSSSETSNYDVLFCKCPPVDKYSTLRGMLVTIEIEEQRHSLRINNIKLLPGISMIVDNYTRYALKTFSYKHVRQNILKGSEQSLTNYIQSQH